MTANPTEAPITCSLSAAELTDRRGAWERLADRALRERRMTADGVRLVFVRAPGVRDELRELARLESECCAFAHWRVEDHDIGLILDVSTEGAGVGALQAMFDDLANRRRPEEKAP